MEEKEIAVDYLTGSEKIYFDWVTNELGRAEFEICAIVKRNKIKEVYIYSRQQKEKRAWKFTNKEGWNGLDIGSFLYDNKLNDPKVWTTFICKEHKCHSLRLYVPSNSKTFHITTSLDSFCINWR